MVHCKAATHFDYRGLCQKPDCLDYTLVFLGNFFHYYLRLRIPV